ncbi:Nitroreductase [Salinihabitans flavidus]|uniref:Nitroreductase n=1 Tax=Salinihabitans flavidus TaxID=569882 RepID=A0A1H8QLJ8_9RHOB|nr:nitroreductase [Salinihabitans flavidus]SEO54693.1 Nitroreductase [Salinihabitans flavidus]
MTDQQALTRLLDTRHSCRAFRPDPVPRPVIEAILRDAGRAPSWCNAQPWKVWLTSGAATDAFRAAMTDAFDHGAPSADFPFPERYTGPRRERRRRCGYQLYDAVGIPKADRAATARQMRENYRFFGAPHVALITSAAELGPYGALDCGGYITAFCLSAQARGVASVPQAAIAFYSDVVRAHLGIPDEDRVLAAISFGYEDTDHPANGFRTERATLDDLVTWKD